MDMDEVRKLVQELNDVRANDEIGGDTQYYQTELYEAFIEDIARGIHTRDELTAMAKAIIA